MANKLNINLDDYQSALEKEKQIENGSDKTTTTPYKVAISSSRQTTKKEELTVTVKISQKNKMALSKILHCQEEKTGKFVALNRFIDEILTSYLRNNSK